MPSSGARSIQEVADMPAWELTARERIRHTLAAYTISGDSFRLDELVALFTEDGMLDVVGRESATGRPGIRDMLTRHAAAGADGAGERFFVRHMVTNVLIQGLSPDFAQVVSYFVVLTPFGVDHWGRYRDELQPVGKAWLFRRRIVRVDAASQNSWYENASRAVSSGP